MRSLNFIIKSVVVGASLVLGAGSLNGAQIIHDAEFAKIQEQYKSEWATEDAALKAKLAALEKKNGKKPNIIYFMWDDAAYGRVGHPMLSKLTGIDTPNIDQMAREGMTLTTMYTEPYSTPTRFATFTGTHHIRSW